MYEIVWNTSIKIIILPISNRYQNRHMTKPRDFIGENIFTDSWPDSRGKSKSKRNHALKLKQRWVADPPGPASFIEIYKTSLH